MDAYLMIPLIEVAFTLGLLAALIFGGLRHIARKPFACFLAFMSLWGFFIFMMRATSDLEVAFFWEKFVFIAILSAALFFYRFALSFTGRKESKSVFYPVLVLYFLSIGLVPTGLVVSGMQTMWYGKAPVVGPLFFLYVLSVYVPIILGLILLLKHFRASRVLNERTRITYVAAGIIIMFIGGTTDYLPAVGLNVYPLGIVGNIIFCLLATVGMLRYGLLEFRVVVRRGATVALIAIFLIGIVTLVTYVFNTMFGSTEPYVIPLVTAVLILALAPVSGPLVSGVQRVVDKWFYGKRYDHLQALEVFCRETKDMMDLAELSSSLVTMIARGTQASNVYLMIPNTKSGGFTEYASYKENGAKKMSFPASSLISQSLQYYDGIVDVNDLEAIPSLHGVSEGDKHTLSENQIELLVPLRAKERLTGMLLLSRRLPDRPYSTEERRLLETVAHHSAMAIENARLYEELKQQLVSSSKLASLGELAAYVAHEVNNGLQAVINFGTILQEDLTDEAKKADCQVIETEALRARNIVETLLGIARQERLGRAAIDVNDLLRSVVTLARLRAKSENITITESYCSEPIFVDSSSEQLRQVFLNLFTNATDAMPDGGQIKVETSVCDEKVVISVADTGVGIPKTLRQKIFEPLFSTKNNGSGLGLTVSSSIIREHGGEISVDSEEGRGSKFTITLPRINSGVQSEDAG